jgi:hypothetical protein
LVIAEKSIVNEEDEIVASIPIQVEHQALTWFRCSPLAALVMKIGLEYVKAKDAIPLAFSLVKPKEFQEVASRVEA